MVLCLQDQDDRMKENADSLLIGQSTQIGELDGGDLTVNRCPVNGHDNLTAYWIGDEGYLASYVIVQPMQFQTHSFSEVVYAFTIAPCRRQGMHKMLLEHAGRQNPLLSDRNGMTESAFHSWQRANPSGLRWFDMQSGEYVDSNDVPNDQQFSKDPEAAR